jgi:uncharacterized membrane protein YraQ (UPF0718 family)
MQTITNIIYQTLLQTVTSFAHNWPFLIISIVISVLLKLFLDSNKAANFLLRHQRAGVLGATAMAVTTPLCSCGTTAVVLGMMASLLPWAPIVAFMVASPLTSPEELVYSAGLFGWHFAWAFFISSILLGLLGGLAAAIMEKRGWLKNQARMSGLATSPSPRPLPQGAREQTGNLGVMQETVSVNRWEFATAGGLTLQPEDTHDSSDEGNRTFDRPAGGCGCAESDEASPEDAQAPGGCGCGESDQAHLKVEPSTATCRCSTPSLEIRPPQVVTSNACSKETVPAAAPACACARPAGKAVQAQTSSCGCGAPAPEQTPAQAKPRVTWRLFGKELFTTGKRLLIMFAGFAFIGYLLNNMVPAAWVAAIFGKGNIYSVPLAATLGVPFYINTEGSLPLVRALIDGGMSQGAALAFLITGAGTSVGAIAGALTIARWRVIGLVVGTLWVGAVAIGFLYNFLLAAGLV